MKFTNFNRKEYIKKLAEEEFDVLIIGGGITGAGIALDAVTRGMKVALVDMQDFSAGTSSRSTKLVHGGLRYLKQLEFKVVAEVGKERAIVYENGPHVTSPEWMLLPIHKGGTFGKFSTSIGLRVYDFLAGVKMSERRKMINEKETLNKEPLLKREGLQGGGYYVEYRTDDARLTVEVLKEAVASGAIALNYAKVNQLEYYDGLVCGAVVHDLLNDSIFKVKAKKVVNATGPWVDTIREKDHSKKGKKLRLSKGVHLVIDQTKFPLKQAIYFDTPDGRMVFAIPRAGKAYVGTTDTFYDQDPIHPTMTESDRNYIIDAIQYMFPKVKIGISDIESSWAGVRPLIYEEGKDPSEISRKDEIWTSPSGLITIAGGKLTGYRKMAETVVDLLAVQLDNGNGRYSTCHTKNMPISGGKVGGSENFTAFIQSQVTEGIKAGLTKKDAESIAAMYGSNANILFEIATIEQKKKGIYNLPLLLLTQLVYALEYEMITTPVDFFCRRTGYMLFDIDLVKKYEQEVILFMADRLNWSEKQTENFKKELSLQIIDSTIPLDDSNRNDVIKKLS